jgi:hypothetical protein
MGTAFGILLFVVVYAPVAYMVYDELTGRRSRVRFRVPSRVGRSARQQRRHRGPQLTGR